MRVLADVVEVAEVRRHTPGPEQKVKKMIAGIGVEIEIELYVSAYAETQIDQRLTFFCRSTRCSLME